MGQAGSILDPTRTRPAGVGWRVEEPGLDPSEKSVESVSGEVNVSRVGQVARIKKASKFEKKSHRNLEIFAGFYIFLPDFAFFG